MITTIFSDGTAEGYKKEKQNYPLAIKRMKTCAEAEDTSYFDTLKFLNKKPRKHMWSKPYKNF